VLEFAGGEPLGVLVADLLELERALQRDRVVQPAPDEEVRVGVGVLARAPGGPRVVEDRLDVPGEVAERGDGLAVVPAGGDVEPEEVQRHQLRGERLGRGDADFGTGTDVEPVIALAGHRRLDGVGERDGFGAPAARGPDRRERVGGLAAL
jgi:hypothetical protein